MRRALARSAVLKTASLALATAPALRVGHCAVQHLALDRLSGNRTHAPATTRNTCEARQLFCHSPLQLLWVWYQLAYVKLRKLLAAFFAFRIKGEAVHRGQTPRLQRVQRIFVVATIAQPGAWYMQNTTAGQRNQPIIVESVAAFEANGAFIAAASNLVNINYWIANNNITANGGAAGWRINVDDTSIAGKVVVTAVPEPSTFASFGMGLALLVATRSFRRKS